MDSPAEVRNLQGVPHADEDVLRLDVSVDHMLRVAVPDGLRDLLEVPGRPGLGELPPVREQVVELPARRELQHEVDPLLVDEEAEEAQGVDVAEVRLDLDLAPQLVLHPVADELALVQYFQGESEMGAALLCQVHVTKLSRTEASPDVDFLQAERRRLDLGGRRHDDVPAVVLVL